MFSVSPMALYTGDHRAVPTRSIKKDPATKRPSTAAAGTGTGAVAVAAATSVDALQPHSPLDSQSSSGMEQLSSASVENFLGRAIDSPPSPEKLRQLNRQMQSTSISQLLRRNHGHHAAPSESSSTLSFNTNSTERFAWDNRVGDSPYLERHPSTRSDGSSISHRERSESLTNFGKSLFQRRGKSRREGSSLSTQSSSSSSSLYSAESPVDNTAAAMAMIGAKDGIIPSIFSRRKASRDETIHKRPQISEPFNFQHVTHSNRGNASDSGHVRRLEPMDESAMDGPMSTPLPFNASFDSMDALRRGSRGGDLAGAFSSSRPSLMPHHTAPLPGLANGRFQQRQQYDSSQPPPRPPRSPLQPKTAPWLPHLSPPRASSRQSVRMETMNAPPTVPSDRPSSVAASRLGHRFGPAASSSATLAWSPSHESLSSNGSEYSVEEHRFSRIMVGDRDSTWPLASPEPSFDAPLPDVPEEEHEVHGPRQLRRSTLSVASNHSSLRGSQSVPMLRSLAEAHRPGSGASDTLGGLGITGLSRLASTGPQSPAKAVGSPLRENWEEDIDYVYEHEAEADCDYQWERPSMDTARDSNTPPAVMPQTDSIMAPSSLNDASPRFMPDGPSGQGEPSISTASQTSVAPPHEQVRPNSAQTNHFSLPRYDRRSIRLETIKDHRQTIAGRGHLLEPEKQGEDDFDDFARQHRQYELQEHDAQGTADSNKTSPLLYQRSSTSTNSTSRSDSTGKWQRSTNSSWTTLTRRTASSGSLHKMAGVLAEEEEPLPSNAAEARPGVSLNEAARPPSTRDTVPEMIPFPPANGLKRYMHKSHASESVIREEMLPRGSTESPKPPRPRARTTSTSAQSPPPIGQYALFPQSAVQAGRDHL